MNKYTRWYNSITQKAKSRDLPLYTETHHIVPKSLGGSDEKENLVALTAREHFICHWLLVKMHNGEAKAKMIYALNGMKRTNKHQERYETKITSRVYQKLKEEFSKVHSEFMSGKPAHNKGKPMSAEQKELLRVAMTGRKVDPEVLERRISSQTGKKRSEEDKAKISAALKGKAKGPMSEENKKRISEGSKGKPKSAECTQKKAETLKKLAAEGMHHSIVKVTCPHCAKEVTKLVYSRLHGDRCRSKEPNEN